MLGKYHHFKAYICCHIICFYSLHCSNPNLLFPFPSHSLFSFFLIFVPFIPIANINYNGFLLFFLMTFSRLISLKVVISVCFKNTKYLYFIFLCFILRFFAIRLYKLTWMNLTMKFTIFWISSSQAICLSALYCALALAYNQRLVRKIMIRICCISILHNTSLRVWNYITYITNVN